MKTKAFDCVAMKRLGAAELRKRLAGMTPAEELAFWKAQTSALRRLQRKVSQPPQATR